MDSNFRFRREDRVSSLGLLLARNRGVGADVSVQPGFVIIMPSPLEASGAPLCCSPVDPEDDERDQAPTIRAICYTEGCKIFGVDKSAEITVNWFMRLPDLLGIIPPGRAAHRPSLRSIFAKG